MLQGFGFGHAARLPGSVALAGGLEHHHVAVVGFASVEKTDQIATVLLEILRRNQHIPAEQIGAVEQLLQPLALILGLQAGCHGQEGPLIAADQLQRAQHRIVVVVVWAGCRVNRPCGAIAVALFHGLEQLPFTGCIQGLVGGHHRPVMLLSLGMQLGEFVDELGAARGG